MTTIKKIILLVLIMFVIIGCGFDEKQPDGTYKPYYYETYIIDSCEYIGLVVGNQSDYLAHKGNCCFCKKRRQKELEELVTKLKENK